MCAAGLAGSTADDVGKEVAIFRAHKATPIVVADDGDARYPGVATIAVPPIDPALAFVLSTMAGHLFGYEAALAIDASAIPLREAREVIERAVSDDVTADAVLTRVRAEIGRPAEQYVDGLRNARYDGHLEASTAVRLAGLLRDVLSDHPVEEYQLESGKVGSPAALLDDLVGALTRAIEELTRPVDAIKHQAKTVTVGISRSDEGVIDRPLVQAVLAAGAGRDVLSYKTLKVLADLDPAVAEVVGFTRYGVDGDTITVVDRGGLSIGLASRVERRPVLSGTKRSVATQREVLVARGRSDGRTVIFVPEVKANVTTGITLLHVRFHDRLDAATMRGVLQGYDRRYDRLVDWVSETEGAFDERLLGELPVADLLIEPISDAADHWRTLRGPRPANARGRQRRSAARNSAVCDSGAGESVRTARLAVVIIGVGVDAVDVERFRRVLARTPSMRERLFTAAELAYVEPRIDPVPSLAARFAAREAVMKALGLGLGAFGFHDVSVARRRRRRAEPDRHRQGGRAGRRAAGGRLPPLAVPRRARGRRRRGRRRRRRAVIPIVTPEEMAAIDAAAPEPVDVLVGRAGAAVARAARRMLGGTYGRVVNVIAGKGNNGADGRVAGELLAVRRCHRAGVRGGGVPVVAAAGRPRHRRRLRHRLPRRVGGAAASAMPGSWPSTSRAVSTGSPASPSPGTLAAAETVTFAAMKPGLLVNDGKHLAGEVTVADIGLDVSSARAHVVERADVAGWWRPRPVDAHKWTRAVRVVAGSPGMTGAASLAASAAMRAGAGIVWLSTPGEASIRAPS